MARINIEDSIYSDSRFSELVLKLGSRTLALGSLVEAFVLAQKFYLNQETQRLIPEKEWIKHKIRNEILDVGLAEKRGDMVYVCGSDTQFGWLVQRSNAGKASKKARSTDNDRTTTVSRSKALPLTLTLKEEEGERPQRKILVFKNQEELIEAIPLVTRDVWLQRYKDQLWIDEQCGLAFTFHCAEQEKIPRSQGLWMKKLATWLEIAWKNKGREKKASEFGGWEHIDGIS